MEIRGPCTLLVHSLENVFLAPATNNVSQNYKYSGTRWSFFEGRKITSRGPLSNIFSCHPSLLVEQDVKLIIGNMVGSGFLFRVTMKQKRAASFFAGW